MIYFNVPSAPSIGDWFTYNGDKYQLITNPKDAGLRGGLLKATARYTNGDVCWEHPFYFEVRVINP